MLKYYIEQPLGSITLWLIPGYSLHCFFLFLCAAKLSQCQAFCHYLSSCNTATVPVLLRNKGKCTQSQMYAKAVRERTVTHNSDEYLRISAYHVMC